MRRGRSTGNPTKAQRARFAAIHESGCVVASMRGIGYLPPEIHHLLIGGHHGQKRRGHDYTIGLNSWSHRGVPLPGWTKERCREVLGPSYALEPRLFRETFGQDDVLLDYQNRLLTRQAA